MPTFPGGSEVKASASSLGREDPLEKEMATHSSILVWRTPWTEELGRLQSMGRKESDTTEQLHLHHADSYFKTFCFSSLGLECYFLLSLHD